MLRFGLLIALGTLALDQITKWSVMTGLFGLPFWQPAPGFPWEDGVTVTGFFNLVTVWNRGVSFGLFSNASHIGPWALSAVAAVISVILVFWLRKTENRLLGVGLGMILGGAIGNVIDRVRFGAVFDFLDFHAVGYHWPAFNLADCGVVVGVFFVLLDGIFARDTVRE